MLVMFIIAMLLGDPILILLFLFIFHEDSSNSKWEYSEKQKERRHKELMKIQEERLDVARQKKSEAAKRRVRTMIRDERGRFIAQEVIEDYDEEDDYDDIDVIDD